MLQSTQGKLKRRAQPTESAAKMKVDAEENFQASWETEYFSSQCKEKLPTKNKGVKALAQRAVSLSLLSKLDMKVSRFCADKVGLKGYR